MLKPERLFPGDKVAAVSLSWGGPGEFPQRYLAGKEQFEAEFELSVEEMPNAMRKASWLAENPQARADDLLKAFSDNKYKAVISTIGGDDSIRLLPYLDYEVLRKNPKIFLGYSDTTVSHLAMYKAGLVSFYGPAFMSGFAENGGIPKYLANSVRETLFQAKPSELMPNTEGWMVERIDWGNSNNQSQLRKVNPVTGWRWLQGDAVSEGHLLGGCIEVLDWMRGTDVWPTTDQWKGAIIFLETSEEAPSPMAVQRMLRSLGAQEILQSSAGILFGRPGGEISPQKFPEYDKAILDIVNKELGLSHLPIITNMDFGHTDPIMTLPYGVKAKIDCVSRRIFLTESSVA